MSEAPTVRTRPCPIPSVFRLSPLTARQLDLVYNKQKVTLDAGLDRESQGVTNALVYAIAEDDAVRVVVRAVQGRAVGPAAGEPGGIGGDRRVHHPLLAEN